MGNIGIPGVGGVGVGHRGGNVSTPFGNIGWSHQQQNLLSFQDFKDYLNQVGDLGQKVTPAIGQVWGQVHQPTWEQIGQPAMNTSNNIFKALSNIKQQQQQLLI